MKYLLTISYCGTRYSGWQSQKNGTGVQQILTQACNELFGIKCNVTGCSRTDAGVHALEFRAALCPSEGEFTSDIPAEKIPFALNSRLPEDI